MNKILIADDCKELLFAMKLFLESKGYQIETVSKSRQIFKKIYKFNPNLIITDVFMEGKDGLELCREVRQNPLTKDLKILVFSSSAKQDPGSVEMTSRFLLRLIAGKKYLQGDRTRAPVPLKINLELQSD